MADTAPVRSSGSEASQDNTPARSTLSDGRGTVMGEGYALQSGFANLPRRPNFIPEITNENQNQMQEIDVVGNSFSVNIAEDFNFEVVKYDVIFDPPIQEDANQREHILQNIEGNLIPHIGHHALDNARVYAWRPTTMDENEDWQPVDNIKITYDQDKFVELRAGQRNMLLDMDLQYQQQVLSVFLRELARHCGFIRMGRNHYDPAATDRDVNFENASKYKGLLKMMDGYRMSLEYTCTAGADDELQNGVCLTIDACSRVLDPRNVREVIDEIVAECNNPKAIKKALIGELRGRAVITEYNNKIYKINELVFNANPSTTMMKDPTNFEGEEMTVADFYKQKYNLEPDDHELSVLFCHDLAPRKRDQGKTRPLYLIPAFCKLTGYPPKIRKNHALMKRLARSNKIPSDIRATKVEDCAKRLAEAAREMHNPLQIEAQLMKIKGRILGDAPICLRDEKKGVQKIDINKLQMAWKKYGMFGQVKLDKGKWAMIGDKKASKKFKKLYKAMAANTKSMGANMMGEPVYYTVEERGSKAWMKVLIEIAKTDPQAVVAVIPCSRQPDQNDKQKADEIYAAVKRVCSKEYPIPSQCVQSCNMETSHVQVGITRQLYTKLGSLPWKLKFCLFGDNLNLRKPTMLVGIDVNHDRKEAQSPVAFVSTWDRDFVRVHSQLSYHKLADEVLNPEEMSQFMVTAMNNFKDKNRVFPQQIIVYRDGIASTQIEHVQKNELAGISKAFKILKLKEKKDVKLEYLLVNKRVNSRFVDAETYQNVPKGLIVDNVVVSSQYWDFYITPADAPEGCTSTPTRFIIIRDDLNLSRRKATIEIEAFTKQLCNLYYNWPGPVRVPHIVKNADKLTTQFGSAVNGSVPHHLLQDTYHFL